MAFILFLVSPMQRTSQQGASEDVEEIAGGANGMDVDRIGEVGDSASEGQAARVWDRFP